MKDSKVYVVVDGKKLSGWTSVKITEKLEAIARAFEIGYTQIPGETDPLNSGDAVEIMIGDDLILTGWVTKISTSYTSKSLTRTITGASKTIDLGDCCLPLDADKQYKKLTPRELLQKICESFGIQVVDRIGKTDRISASFNSDSKIFDVLKKVLLKNSLLLTDDERGRLVIATSKGEGTATDALVLGENVLSCEFSEDASELFSQYGVVGQGTNAGSDKTAKDIKPLGRASSTRAGRARTKVVVQKGNATREESQTRADNMKAYAEARSRTMKYTVHGWRQSDGSLWKPNSLVRVKDPITGSDEELLITEISYTMDASGQKTQITCLGADAFAYTDEPNQAAAAEKSAKSKAKKSSNSTSAQYTKIKSTKSDWTTK